MTDNYERIEEQAGEWWENLDDGQRMQIILEHYCDLHDIRIE